MSDTRIQKLEYFQKLFNYLSSDKGKVVLKDILAKQEPEESTTTSTEEVEKPIEKKPKRKINGPRAEGAKPILKRVYEWVPPADSERLMVDGTYNNKPNDPNYFNNYYAEHKGKVECKICNRMINPLTKSRHEKSNKCMVMNLKKELMAKAAIATYSSEA
jgi:hypothetical protein